MPVRPHSHIPLELRQFGVLQNALHHALSAAGEVLTQLAASKPTALLVVGGARFLGGSDEYSRLWQQHAGFGSSYVRNFEAVSVDRKARSVAIDGRFPEATEQVCRGKSLVLFVTAEKA